MIEKGDKVIEFFVKKIKKSEKIELNDLTFYSN